MAQSKIVEIDTSQLEHLKTQLEEFPDIARRAQKNATRRTKSRVVTKIAEFTTKEYAIKRKDIKPYIKTYDQLKYDFLSCTIEVKSSPLGLHSFKFNARKRNLGTRRKKNMQTIVSSEIKKGNKFSFLPNSGVFTMKTRKGKEVVMRRYRPGEPQYEYGYGYVYTVTFAQMASNPNVYDQIAEDAGKFYTERFIHEFEHIK